MGMPTSGIESPEIVMKCKRFVESKVLKWTKTATGCFRLKEELPSGHDLHPHGQQSLTYGTDDTAESNDRLLVHDLPEPCG